MFQGNKQLRAEGEVVEYTKKQIDEFIKCKEDIIYFAEKYFYITSNDKGKHKIQLYEFQKKILKVYQESPDGRPNTILLLPRQMGKCVFYDTKLKIRNKKTKEIKEITVKEFFDNQGCIFG